ncbi:MAG: hypothetical protein ACLVEJ_04890 [Parabacteroides sp.]
MAILCRWFSGPLLRKTVQTCDETVWRPGECSTSNGTVHTVRQIWLSQAAGLKERWVDLLCRQTRRRIQLIHTDR